MILCFLASLSYARLRAQTRPVAVAPQRAAAASQPPYDRLELLASLRAFESKPYLVDKIRDRGVDFTPDGTFLEGVDSRLNTPDILDAIAESRRSGVPESPERHKAYLILVDVILQRLTPSVREQYEAAVAFIDPRIDAASGLFRVKLLLDNPNHDIKAGMRAEGEFTRPAGTAAAP